MHNDGRSLQKQDYGRTATHEIHARMTYSMSRKGSYSDNITLMELFFSCLKREWTCNPLYKKLGDKPLPIPESS